MRNELTESDKHLSLVLGIDEVQVQFEGLTKSKHNLKDHFAIRDQIFGN